MVVVLVMVLGVEVVMDMVCDRCRVGRGVGDLNTINLVRIQDFRPTWIRIQGYTINFERKDSK